MLGNLGDMDWAWTGLGEARAPGQGSALRPGSDVPGPGPPTVTGPRPLLVSRV